MLKKSISLLLALIMVISLFTIIPVSAAEGEKCIFFDYSTAGWGDYYKDMVQLSLYDLNDDGTINALIDSRYGTMPDGNTLRFDLSDADLVSGRQYYIEISFWYQGVYCGIYPLLFDTSCCGDTVCCTGTNIGRIRNEYGDAYTHQQAKWRTNSSLGMAKLIDYYGNVTGEMTVNDNDYALFLNYLKSGNYSYNGKTAQVFFDGVASALGLSADDVDRAMAESQKNIRWNKNYSALNENAGENCLILDYSALGIKNESNIEGISFSAYNIDGSSVQRTSSVFGSPSKGVRWFDPAFNGMMLEDGKQYYLV